MPDQRPLAVSDSKVSVDPALHFRVVKLWVKCLLSQSLCFPHYKKGRWGYREINRSCVKSMARGAGHTIGGHQSLALTSYWGERKTSPFGLGRFFYRPISIWWSYLRSSVFLLFNPNCFWNKYYQKKKNPHWRHSTFFSIFSCENGPASIMPKLFSLLEGCSPLDLALGLASSDFSLSSSYPPALYAPITD